MRHSLSVFKWGEDFPEKKRFGNQSGSPSMERICPVLGAGEKWNQLCCNTRTTRASKHCTKCTLCTLNCTPGWCSYCTFFCTNYIARKAHKIEDPNARHDRKGDKMQAPVWTCQILQIMRALVRRSKSLTALHISLHCVAFFWFAARGAHDIKHCHFDLRNMLYPETQTLWIHPYTISKS